MLRKLLWVPWTALFALACSDGASGTCATSADCSSGACVSGRCEAASDAGPGGADAALGAPDATPSRRLLRVVVSPDTAMLVSTDGARVTQAFTATAEYSDGSTQPAAARWTVSPLTLGDIGNASGLFTASGFFGGTATVEAIVRDGTTEGRGQATVTVKLDHTILAPGTDPSAPNLFAGQPARDPARAAGIAYPLEGAVMPQNVFPADIQWRNGEVGDVFRVRIIKPSAQITAYVGFDGQNHLLPDEPAWRRLAQTDPDAPARIEVTRYLSGSRELVDGDPVSVRFARAALSGSIYYWDIAAGRIVRIDDGTAGRVQFLPSPPQGCVGCHSVSTSGRYMAGRFGGGDNVGGVLDLTRDLTADPPPMEFPVDQATTIRWWFSSWSPDDRRMIVSTNEGTARELKLVDPFAGTYLTPAAGTLPSGATHPAWAPDNSAIAYVGDLDNWGGANTTGGLYTLPITGPDSFGTPTRVHDGASLSASIPTGNADSYPTWTPDSQRLVFAHGSSSRSENGRAALFIVNKDGSNVVRLDRASGGADTSDTFQPRMSPFDSGGYYWVSYLSRRDYGNAAAGTAGTARQQIWISAIKKNPAPGEDPSEVGYWLPGQSPASMNISAYWAPRPCRADGVSCGVASECCGGDCRPDAMGALVCAPGPGMGCREIGQSCTVSADCCDGNLCAANGVCGSF